MRKSDNVVAFAPAAYADEGLNRLILPEELMTGGNGYGWIEFLPEPDVSPDIDPDEFLQEAVWLGDDLLMKDIYGCTSTGKWSRYDPAMYGRDWRVWTMRPDARTRQGLPWTGQQEG